MDLHVVFTASHTQADFLKIADYVGNNTQRFKVLIEVYTGGPYRVTQHSIRVISLCVEKHPHLVTPHLGVLVNMLDMPAASDAVKRNTLRLLQDCPIPRRLEGKIIDLCFGYLLDKSMPVAIHVFAMSVLFRLTAAVPEMQKELKIILEERLPYGSPGFVSRARKILQHPDIQGIDAGR